MNAQQIQQAATFAISQMNAEEKAVFIQMFEAGHHEITQTMAVGYACQAIHNQQVLASMAIDRMEEFSALIGDML